MNLIALAADSLLSIDGVDLGRAGADVRKVNRKSVLLVRIAEDSTVAGMLAQSRSCTAPMQVCREHLAGGKGARATVVNTGNASAGTSAPGLAHARQTCDVVTKLLNVLPEQVLPFSTGVTLRPLSVDCIITGLPAAETNAKPDDWLAIAEAVMTTDTIPEAASVTYTLSGRAARMLGISRGAGIVRPNMATVPGFIATDANVNDAAFQELVRHAADHSLNSMTVDGDTFTSDSFVVIVTGRANAPRIGSESHPDYTALRDALAGLIQELTRKITRGGEGVTKFITIQAEDGRNTEKCRLIVYTVACSPLVKTTFYASDPNLGRILAAVGYADMAGLDANGVNLRPDDVWVMRSDDRNLDYREGDGQHVTKQVEITMRIALGRGDASAIVWAYDFLHDYVSINADYRS